MKKERNAQKLEVRSKTKQRMDLSFFLSFFLSVCLFPLLVLILVLFPFSTAPPEAKRHIASIRSKMAAQEEELAGLCMAFQV